MMKLLLGGSPCTHWSIAQTKNRETKPEGQGWELFKNYLIALEKFKAAWNIFGKSYEYRAKYNAYKEARKQAEEEAKKSKNSDDQMTLLEVILNQEGL